MRLPVFTTCAGVVLVAVSAAACSSGSTTATAARPAATSTSGPSGNDPSSSLKLSKLVLDGGDPSLCQYLFNGSKTAPYAVITFNSAPGITAAAFESGLKKEQSDVKAVPGLADDAFTFTGTTGGSGLSFLSGDTICSIYSTVPTTTAGKIALAKSILGS